MKLGEIIYFLQTISKCDDVWDNKRLHKLMNDIKEDRHWKPKT
jgi:hypothetical protein